MASLPSIFQIKYLSFVAFEKTGLSFGMKMLETASWRPEEILKIY